jgi:KUP system potassium uptake protein
MAVTATVTITTLLFFYIVRTQWHKPLWMVLLGGGAFLVVDLFFLAANLTKLTHGAWLPLVIGVVLFTILTTWQRGRAVVTAQRAADEGPLGAFIEDLHARRPPLQRVSGTAVFLNRGRATTPLAMRANVVHNHILHEHVILMSVQTLPVPYVDEADRIAIDTLGFLDDRISHVEVRYGYLQQPDVPAALRLAAGAGLESPPDLTQVSYFLSKIELGIGDSNSMPQWQKHLFVATSQIAADSADYFSLPREQTVIMGSQIRV